MSFSAGPLIVAIALTQRLRKQAKLNELPKLAQVYQFCFFFSILLFVVEGSFSLAYIINWAWFVFLIAIIVFSLKQEKLKVSRIFIWAFIPYIIASFATELTKFIAKDFFSKWENYFEIASLLGFMWMAAMLFSQNRQNKIAEKERIKKEQEDKLNKAIAIRKVELEGEVAERTAELTKQKDELQLALTELQTTQTQLIQSEKMASLGELTAGIAHEIQNPLNFVNNFSEVNAELIAELVEEVNKGNIAEVKAIAKDIQDNEEKINHHGKRADAIVKGMLQHSRSSTGVKEPTDINALVDEYLRLSYHGLRAKDKSFNATLKTDYDESINKINVIPQDIGRVVMNLLTNAFYAVNEKKKENIPGYEPTVTISTNGSPLLRRGFGGEVSIKVEDNGNGIPQRVLEKIFQPFFTTKPTGQGTGLGLSMSYDIITKGHAGELKVETNEGSGTSFIINLNI
ncbi:MAG: ATP-binding protein [Ferruginibacter sp.]